MFRFWSTFGSNGFRHTKHDQMQKNMKVYFRVCMGSPLFRSGWRRHFLCLRKLGCLDILIKENNREEGVQNSIYLERRSPWRVREPRWNARGWLGPVSTMHKIPISMDKFTVTNLNEAQHLPCCGPVGVPPVSGVLPATGSLPWGVGYLNGIRSFVSTFVQ